MKSIQGGTVRTVAGTLCATMLHTGDLVETAWAYESWCLPMCLWECRWAESTSLASWLNQTLSHLLTNSHWVSVHSQHTVSAELLPGSALACKTEPFSCIPAKVWRSLGLVCMAEQRYFLHKGPCPSSLNHRVLVPACMQIPRKIDFCRCFLRKAERWAGPVPPKRLEKGQAV